jgi:hypothetical protein
VPLDYALFCAVFADRAGAGRARQAKNARRRGPGPRGSQRIAGALGALFAEPDRWPEDFGGAARAADVIERFLA